MLRKATLMFCIVSIITGLLSCLPKKDTVLDEEVFKLSLDTIILSPNFFNSMLKDTVYIVKRDKIYSYNATIISDSTKIYLDSITYSDWNIKLEKFLLENYPIKHVGFLPFDKSFSFKKWWKNKSNVNILWISPKGFRDEGFYFVDFVLKYSSSSGIGGLINLECKKDTCNVTNYLSLTL